MGGTVVCAASGPSLKKKDLDYCRGKADVFVVNDVYLIAPWANLLYACDFAWWDHHFKNVAIRNFKGEKWSISKDAAKLGVNIMGHVSNKTWSKEEHYVATGRNSGFQAVNMADLRGYDRIILLGFDMMLAEDGKRHFFGDHPTHLNKDSKYQGWIEDFEKAAPLIRAEVINCTRKTALSCFRKAKLEDVL